MRDEVDTFLFEGHDTTASGMLWSLVCLAQHPDIADRCKEEVDQVMGSDQEPTMEHLDQMVYLQVYGDMYSSQSRSRPIS